MLALLLVLAMAGNNDGMVPRGPTASPAMRPAWKRQVFTLDPHASQRWKAPVERYDTVFVRTKINGQKVPDSSSDSYNRYTKKGVAVEARANTKRFRVVASNPTGKKAKVVVKYRNYIEPQTP